MGGRLTAVLVTAATAGLLAGCGSQPSAPAGPEGVVATITTPARGTSTTAATKPGATPTAPTATGPADGWYLALGDSLAAGFQPTTGDQPARGYAGPVLTGLRQQAPGTQLKNLGCSGETTTSMLRGGLCSYPEGSQQAAAVAFLKANADRTRLVTLDMGANNTLRCARPAVDQACATSSTATVAKELGTIVGQLRAAAPKVRIVLLTYYNPLLAGWRQGADGQKIAADTQPLLAGLNTVVGSAAKASGATVADVAGAFATADGSGSPEPVNVQRVCAWTWMCSRNDIHANDDGYAAMAKAVLAAL